VGRAISERERKLEEKLGPLLPLIKEDEFYFGGGKMGFALNSGADSNREQTQPGNFRGRLKE
jgi:hypothetical protein